MRNHDPTCPGALKKIVFSLRFSCSWLEMTWSLKIVKPCLYQSLYKRICMLQETAFLTTSTACTLERKPVSGLLGLLVSCSILLKISSMACTFPVTPLKLWTLKAHLHNLPGLKRLRWLPLSQVAHSVLLSYRPHWDLDCEWACFDCTAGDGHVAETRASLQEGLEGAGLPGGFARTLRNCCHGPGLHQEWSSALS